MRYDNNMNTFIHPTFYVVFIQSQSCMTIHMFIIHSIYLCKVVKGEGEWTCALYNMMSHGANPSAE